MKDYRRLHSGRVSVKQPNEVSSDRYQFLDLASAEPNLGTANDGSVLTTDTAGQRIWTANLVLQNANVTANLSADKIFSDNIYFANGQPYITDVKSSNIYNGTATAGNTITLIDTLSVNNLRSVRWVLSAKDNNNNSYKSSTIDALTDGESVYYNEYGVVLSGIPDVAVFTVAILSGNLNLYADGDSNSVTVTFQRTTLDNTTVSGYVAGAGYIQSAVGSGTATTCVNNSFTGTGSQTNFTLSAAPTDKNQTIVSIGGVLQPKSTYSLNGTTITFNSAPANGVTIDVTTFVTTTITGYTGSKGYTGSAGFLTNWSKKTGNYTATNGDRIIADTSSGSFSITLPSGPGVGSFIEITDGASFYANPLTIVPNGSTIEGQNVNVLVDTAAVDIQLIYDGSTWQVVSTYGPVGYTGSAGPAGGYTGSQGGAGPAGFTGSQGTNGFTGSLGNAGFTGSAGAGFTGSRGAAGFTGSAATGVVGYSGSAGGGAIAGNLFVNGTVTVANSILPTTSNVIDIGSPSLRFGALYLAGNTIDLGGTQITSDANGELIFTTSAGNVSLNANTINFLSSVANTSQAVGSLTITGNVTAAGYFYANGQPLTGGSGGNGYTGSIGATGFTGSAGTQGAIGYTGSAGTGGGGNTSDAVNLAFALSYFNGI